MKQEWQIYIKGNSSRGDEVINILKQHGGKPIKPDAISGTIDTAIYYIDHDGIITFSTVDKETAKIIMDKYREIKLPEQWKNGDILYSDTDKEFAVFKDKWKLDSDKFLAYFVTCYGGYLTLQAIRRRGFRLTTKLEVEQFYEYLHSIGKDWNAEKKQLVDWKWKPNERDYYYYISSLGKVIRTTYLDTDSDKSSFDFGNCFKTKEEAETMAEKIKKLLKGEQL